MRAVLASLASRKCSLVGLVLAFRAVAMTIVCFVVDNSASMNQRTYQGTTLLDSAKTVVETLFKARVNKCRTDRYFLFTLNEYPQNFRLTGWRQSCDLTTFHAALSRINPNGTLSLGKGIAYAFKLLNLNRMQTGFETYGLGLYISSIEPAVVIVVTQYYASFEIDSGIASKVPGGDLTAGSHRWDYWLHGILLHSSGLVETLYDTSRPHPLGPSSSAFLSCTQTGGEVFVLSDLRAIPQYIEAVNSKCHQGVVIDLIDVSVPKEPIAIKQLVLLKENVKIPSFWPIPESFFPTEELLAAKLPSRPSNPVIHTYVSREVPPKFLDYFPVDRYELESSRFTRKVIDCRDTSVIWPCIVPKSGQHSDAPFGYCKLSPDFQTVHLHVLPYNYRELSELLCSVRLGRNYISIGELYDVNGLRMTETWISKLTNYLTSIPRYYYVPISKAFERLGFQGVIKPEVLSRTFSFQFKNGLQRHQHCAQAEYEKLVRDVSEAESIPLVRVPKISLPTLLEKFSELRAFGTVVKPSGRVLYENPYSVSRRKLRKVLPKFRDNLDSILDGVGRPMDSEGIHSQALSEMGDYANYRYAQPHVAPLRELMPTPERVDTFGNPFRRKSNAGFVVDEVSVDDVGFSGPSSSSSLTVRKRSSIKSGEKARAPILNGEVNHALSPNGGSLTSDMEGNGQAGKHSSEDELAFNVNKTLVDELIEIVRSPKIDGGQIFNILTRFVGSLQQKYDSVSFVMAEALRFKRIDLYNLLNEWRSYLAPLREPAVGPNNGLRFECPLHLLNGSD
ncbi:Integrator complex subunit 6 [Taenia solium]|eukprot:TsM_000589700 transcript=TsM_000589700 gene=TsM_000589700